MIDDDTRTAASDLLDLLEPIGGTIRPMFGGYCFYLGGKVVGTVCDGRIFIKRSGRDELLEGYAELAPPYPGAKDSWRIPVDAVADDPELLISVIEQVSVVLASRKAKP